MIITGTACDRHSPLALNKLRLLWLACAHYITYGSKMRVVHRSKNTHLTMHLP